MNDSSERWWHEVDSMRREMERFLNHFHGSKPPPLYFSPTAWEPSADVYDTTDETIVLLELPGVAQDSIEIVVEGSTLRVRGSRQQDEACANGCYYQVEILRGPFEKAVQLPGPVDAEQTEATYRDGILRIRLRKPSAQRSHRVPIHTAQQT